MNFKYLHRIIFTSNTPIKIVLERFNETAIHTEKQGFAIITDQEGVCIGVISDGDIRRKLLEGLSIEESVSLAANREYTYVRSESTTHEILRQFDKRVLNIPVLDIDDRPVDLRQYSKFVASTHADQRIIRARVPVRVSFSGGGTDMSSYINDSLSVILSSTINRYCTASILVRDDNEVHILSKDLNVQYSAKNIDAIEFDGNLDLIKYAIKIMQPQFGFDLEIFAEFEPGTGLGGSSAVVAAVLGALNYFRNEQQLNIYQLADVAYQVERIDMDIYGGWQDQYATIFGGFSWIEFHKDDVVVHPIRLRRETILELEYNLMLFRIGKNRKSSNIQKELIEALQDKSKDVAAFEDMKRLSEELRVALLKGNVKKFGDLLHESWIIKKGMNSLVSNQLVDDCYALAKSHGALGGKLLGAGESGYLLIYASPLYQKTIELVLAKKGVLLERFKFNSTGLEVWSTKK